MNNPEKVVLTPNKVERLTSLLGRFNSHDGDLFADSVYEVEAPLSMPTETPPHFARIEADWKEPQFDPSVHLDIQMPEKITLLNFNEVSMTPQVKGNGDSQLAYTGDNFFFSIYLFWLNI